MKDAPPILPEHRKPPPWSEMTYEESSEHMRRILKYYFPDGNRTPARSDIEDVNEVIRTNMHPDYLDRMNAAR